MEGQAGLESSLVVAVFLSIDRGFFVLLIRVTCYAWVLC